jgi:hypothetical protein
MLAIVERRARPKAERFYRPDGTEVSFCIISQSGSCRILGYFHLVPPSFALAVVRIEKAASRLRRTSRGESWAYNPKPFKLTPMGSCGIAAKFYGFG